MSDLKKYQIYVTKHGSHAYGLNTATSDLDIKGVFVAPKNYYLGFVSHVEQIEEKVPNDSVIFEIRKFFRLAADCNPNIIEVLNTSILDVLWVDKVGLELRENRDLFLSQKAKHTFAGYAHSQLQRIEGHYKWLKNPPKAPPTRAEFDLPERTLIPADQIAAANSMIRKEMDGWNAEYELLDEAMRIKLLSDVENVLSTIQVWGKYSSVDEMKWNTAAKKIGLDDNFIELMDRERRYLAAQTTWKQYQDWKTNRNPARAELEAKYGYDTKHAMHLVRLMRMGEEILTTGKVIVQRPDREELLAIRNQGAWSYEKLITWAHEKDAELDRIYKDGRSPLPKYSDKEKLDKLCVSLVEQAWELFRG